MLLFTSNDLARAVVVYPTCAEYRFCIAWSERRKTLQVIMQAFVYILELYVSKNNECCLYLCRKYFILYIFVETTTEFRYVCPTKRQSACVGMTAKVYK